MGNVDGHIAYLRLLNWALNGLNLFGSMQFRKIDIMPIIAKVLEVDKVVIASFITMGVSIGLRLVVLITSVYH